MVARVAAIERTLAQEAEEDEAALARAEAKQRAALPALDEGYAEKVASIKASMKRLKVRGRATDVAACVCVC